MFKNPRQVFLGRMDMIRPGDLGMGDAGCWHSEGQDEVYIEITFFILLSLGLPANGWVGWLPGLESFRAEQSMHIRDHANAVSCFDCWYLEA